MPPVEIFIISLPLLTVLALGVGSTVRIQRQRHRAAKGAREFAARHSWRYEEESEGLTESFELPVTANAQLNNLRSGNVISGTHRDRAARSWEFTASSPGMRSSRRGGGMRDNAHSHRYHLAALEAVQELPPLTMTSRGGRISRALAGVPSQATGEADFDRTWWATAQDQRKLRTLLDDGFRARLMDFHGELHGLATRGQTLIVWRTSRQLPEDIEPMFEKAAEILRRLERRG